MDEFSIPIKPLGRKDIIDLENALLFGTLFREEVLKLISDPKERLTWVDSLAIAAKALARRQAGMSIREIADELGRSEQTIKRHLDQETHAGKLIFETFEAIKRGELEDLVKFLDELDELQRGERAIVSKEELEKLKEENAKLKEENEKLKGVIEKIKSAIEEV